MRAFKELHIEGALQGIDLFDHSRRRNVEPFRRFVEAPCLGDDDESLELRIDHEHPFLPSFLLFFPIVFHLSI